ncbi:MAG: hypothetical protein NZL99_04875 [Burkholderiaceae bacterium]|nr:hypothetical protein [Burkholderiaceae bacterium]
MRKFFRFPAYRPVLLRIAVAALAYAAAGWLFGRNLLGAPLFGTTVLLATTFGVWVFMARYGFLVIERTAAGYLYPDQYPPLAEQGSPYRPYKMFVIMMVVPMAIGAIGALLRSPALTVALFLAFALLLPAAAMVLTMTDSFFEAINPARSLEVARKIGKPYLVLCLFLLLMLLSSQQAAELVLPRLLAGPLKAHGAAFSAGGSPQAIGGALGATFGLAFFALGFIGNYFFMLMCVLLGYTMYQYADALGVSVVGPGEARTLGRLSSSAHQRRVRDALIGQMVAAGEIREAIEMIREDLRERPNDLSLHGRLHKLLLIEGSTPRIEDHAERYLELLVATDNAREALPLVEAAFARRPEYEPRKPELVVPLARAALAAGKPKLAAQLIRGFDRRHRMHPEIPNVYLIGAQLMLESGAPAEQARTMLQHLIDRYPQHPAAAEAKRMAQRLPAGAAG